jgi:DNA topoisomerase-1
MKNLIIVESPTKSRTISKFLGNNYQAVSSYGHVRDLPKGELGIDTEKNFEPKYIIPAKARKTISALKKEIVNSDSVILATDEDREGEAIAWHLSEALKLRELKVKSQKLKVERIVFHEITKGAIENALENPRDINMDLVDAQQARRILDRLVGYKLSPFLWKKVVRGLSAGRVQSVAVRLIVEREREIQKFKPKKFWSVQALLSQTKIHDDDNNNKKTFIAQLHAKDGKTLDKLAIENKKEADEILAELKDAHWKVGNVEQKEHRRNPLPPFITSTLQRTAWNNLGYSAKRTMMLAQNLYERGLITYHRTDSFNIAQSAVSGARNFIEAQLGKNYLPQTPRIYKTKIKSAQEAHEAIRPTNPDQMPTKLKLEGPQKKLYTLIWQRFIASQMTPANFYSTTVDISTGTSYSFRATGQVMQFDGFLKVYPTKTKEEFLPELKKGEELSLKKLKANQHFTKPPARYNEASLIKALETHGIGRPSTYAGIISTIQERNYAQKNEQKRLEPNEIGFLVNDLLVEHFPQIVDIDFTAKIELHLDHVAQGKEKWQELIGEFYGPFAKKLDEKYKKVEKVSTEVATDRKCAECGKPLVEKFGRFGKFLACSGFPECRHTEPLYKNKSAAEDLGVHCPKCAEGKIVERRTRKGKVFYGCSRYPDCDFAVWYKPQIEEIPGTAGTKRVVKCHKCRFAMVIKNLKTGEKIVCSNKNCPENK